MICSIKRRQHQSLYMALLGWVAALMMRLREGKLPWLSVSLFIKTEGGGKCSKRNWWVKHPPPEELNLQMRAKVVNFNYCSRAKFKPPTTETHLFSIISSLFVCKNITAYFQLKVLPLEQMNVIGPVFWPPWLLSKPKLMLPLVSASFPWAMGDT